MLKKLLRPKKMYSAEAGCYRVQVAANNVAIYYKKDDSPYEVKQPINVDGRSDLEDLYAAIAAVILQYSQDKDE